MRYTWVFLIAKAAVALGACSSTKVMEPTPLVAPVTTAAPVVPKVATGAAAAVTRTTRRTVTVHPLDAPKSPPARCSVFVDFDVPPCLVMTSGKDSSLAGPLRPVSLSSCPARLAT